MKPKKAKPKTEACEMCHNPVTNRIGHPPFLCCGVHANQVRRRVGYNASLLDRKEIRRLMGFVFP